jgi:hypothetical protein
MIGINLKRAALYLLPLLAVVGPVVAYGIGSFTAYREELDRKQRLARVEARPEAAIEQDEYDFGVMDPATEGTHTFLIHNRGGGDLELALGEPSSPSIRGEIPRPIVPPGETGKVLVAWTTGISQKTYAQGVFLETNVPGKYQIPLMVRGAVRVQIGVEPQQFTIARMEPGQPAQASCLLYSQVLPDLAPPQVTCSVAGATCAATPADPESLAAIEAKAGYLVTVTLPADMPSGPFRGEVRMETKMGRDGEPESVTLAVPISGRVLRRLAVYGVGVEETGILDLGIHPPGAGHQRRLVLKVLDDDLRLEVVRAEFRPDFLQWSLTPAGTEGKDHFYHLDITIPADAPPCVYRGVHLGEMKLYFDHPRIPELSLQLALAVISRP